LISDGPRHELVDAVDRVISDAGKYEAQICLGIDVIEFCCPNEAVNRGGTFTAGVRAGKEVVPPSDGPCTQRALDRQVVDLEPTVVATARERLSPVQRIENRPTRIGFL
jgi:hypothetical protein